MERLPYPEFRMKRRFSLLFALYGIMALALVLSACSQDGSKKPVATEQMFREVLSETYGPYDDNGKAWLVRTRMRCASTPDGEIDCNLFSDDPGATESDFFMNIKKTEKVADSGAENGEKYYVIVTGEGDFCTACPGIFGAFVLEWKNARLTVVSSSPYVLQGGYGKASDSWELVSLNSRGYLGWKALIETGSQGQMLELTEIYAPHEKKVVPLLYLTTAYAYSDSFGNTAEDDESAGLTDLKVDLKLDTSAAGEEMYPWRATVSGKLEGKDFSTRTWVISFDEKEWKYAHPDNWPLDAM